MPWSQVALSFFGKAQLVTGAGVNGWGNNKGKFFRNRINFKRRMKRFVIPSDQFDI